MQRNQSKVSMYELDNGGEGGGKGGQKKKKKKKGKDLEFPAGCLRTRRPAAAHSGPHEMRKGERTCSPRRCLVNHQRYELAPRGPSEEEKEAEREKTRVEETKKVSPEERKGGGGEL